MSDIPKKRMIGATGAYNVSISEVYATHIENIVRCEQKFSLRYRYLSGNINKYGGIDIIINKKSKKSKFYNNGFGLDLSPNPLFNSKKHGYKYE